ncbi:YobI family P-loop NTPase [Mycoplasma capricolum]|uniref:YobI family P-loop NTPase n=1 Tax=Mycoplasma capricolum TaxID=2095 RepID=UPI000629FC0F|nr:hypothetical protein [Mycoplasma capricolum]KKW61326.1 DNA-binding protein [Mycoplasma capricolum subsp. capricolum]
MNVNKKFNVLSPITLEQNLSIYDEALDFAIDSSEKRIKNIGISGSYGAGKSTVWNTYVKKRNINNIISISLAKYYEAKSDTKMNIFDNSVFENRIERQIINQIISQIDPKLIPLYSNKIKENKNKREVLINFTFFTFFIVGIVGLSNISLFNDYLKLKFALIFIFNLCWIIPVLWSSINLIKNSKIKILEFNIKGIKGKFNEIDQKDETIFDKEIKQIIYLLYSSNTDYVVFDDLDRYKSIEIFEKLKQLNYLLNNYYKTKNKDKVVKFIYMVSDDLFDNESRTKFFDFIITIIPIKTSKTFVRNRLEAIDIDIDSEYIENILNIITNTRIFLNAINDYLIYKKLVMRRFQLKNSDKLNLFNIILVKNLLPDEFQHLQNNRGIIYELLNKDKEDYCKWAIDSLELKIKEIDKLIMSTSYWFSGIGYEHQFIVRELTNVLSIYDDLDNEEINLGLSREQVKNKPFEENDQTKVRVLARMYENKQVKARVKYATFGGIQYVIAEQELTYDEFFKKFVTKELIYKLNRVRRNGYKEIDKLKFIKKDLVESLYFCEELSINKLLKIIDWDNSNNQLAQKWFEELKRKDNAKNINNFSLIKSIFNLDLINEDYKKYINYIN